MKLNGQFYRELDEILEKELFHAYNSSHMEERHIFINDNEMRHRLKKMDSVDGDICMVSKFDCNTEQILPVIHSCISKNLKELQKWNPNREFLLLHLDQPEPIGHGFVKGTDLRNSFFMSRIRVILAESDIKGRLFSVITAYPVPNLDEIDDIWDNIDQFNEFRRLKKRDA